MEDKKDSGTSHTRATHRHCSTNLLAALQGEVGQNTAGEGGEEKGKSADRGNRRHGEKNKLDKQVWQGGIRQM